MASTPRITIVTSTGLPTIWAEEIVDAYQNAQFTLAEDNLQSVLDCVRGSNAIINCPRTVFGEAILNAAGPEMRWLQLGGAGCEEYLIPRVVNSDIVVTNGKILQGPSVADHAMALTLALTRNIHHAVRNTSMRSVPRPLELRGKRMCVIGLGGIGLLIAERARAFGMTVTGVDPEVRPLLSFLDNSYEPDELHVALAEADVVVMAAPNSRLSRGMMGAKEFKVMKSSAFFVNVSRGATTDTEALTNSLRSGQIAGAALDVTEPEPLPEDHELRHLQNAIVTPHIAGPSDHNRRRAFELIRANIKRFLDGEPLLNEVDKKKGY